MKRTSSVLTVLAVLGAIGAAVARQDKGAPPKPGKEHEFLKQIEGDWEVRTKHWEAKGAAEEGRATETAQMTLGGFWLSFDYKGMYHHASFEGHGFMGYDPAKSKYVGTWMDSLSPHLTWFEGEADSSGRTLTFKTHGFDPKTGKACDGRMVIEMPDRDHHTITFYKPDETGKEVRCSEMTYSRKSAEIR